LAHDLESLLDAARQSKLRITTPIIDIILAGSDALKNYTQQIGHQLKGTNAGKPIVVPTSKLILRVRAALNGEVLPEKEPEAPAPQVPEAPKEPAPKKEQAEKSKLIIRLPQPTQNAVTVNVTHLNPTPAASKEPVKEQSSGFVKLDTAKLDALIDLVGELVIAQSMVVQDPSIQSLDSRTLARSLRQLSRTGTSAEQTSTQAQQLLRESQPLLIRSLEDLQQITSTSRKLLRNLLGPSATEEAPTLPATTAGP
jgi:two-component system chemotaxis sensor kinase CheA